MAIPLFPIIAVVVAAVATLFTVIGLGTTAWIVFPGFESGLFKSCQRSVCSDLQERFVQDWIKATRAFVIIGFLVGLACVVVLVVYIIKKDMKIMQLIGMILAFVAGGCILLGIIIFGAKKDDPIFGGIALELGFSFALTVVGAIFYLIAGIIMVAEKVMGGEGKTMQG